MAGEHILEFLCYNISKIVHGDKWMIASVRIPDKMSCNKGEVEYTVFQHKEGWDKVKTLIQTEDEQEACQTLKGE